MFGNTQAALLTADFTSSPSDKINHGESHRLAIFAIDDAHENDN